MYHFFAMLSRMKYINRWGLMRNTRSENLSEHSLETAIVAHALAVIGNEKFGRSRDPQRAAALALLHDAPEIITGDMPTPVKYHSEDIRKAYAEVENLAAERLVSLLPEELRPYYRLSGNQDFREAERSTLKLLRDMDLPEAKYFMEEFLPSYGLTLDEQNYSTTAGVKVSEDSQMFFSKALE